MRHYIHFLAALCALSACRPSEPQQQDEDSLLGGTTSIEGLFGSMFQQPAPNLSPDELNLHRAADRAFGDNFVTAPSTVNGGLGPIYNQNSCQSCHTNNGRANFPNGNDMGGLLLRLSVNGQDAAGFGGQLQDKGIYGVQPEARVSISERQQLIQYLDGHSVRLTYPVFNLLNPYQPLPAGLQISPRIAPPVIGLGLLEAIAEADILTKADEYDRDGDGISGRPNYILDLQTQQLALGRFGWKASQPNLLQQTAAAYNHDMGITSWLFPHENSVGQPQLDTLQDEPEIDSFTLHAATFYSQSLALPMRRNTDQPEVIHGKRLFFALQCDGCHRPHFHTSQHQYGFLSNQDIYPYSDLLLHDMGAGLADNRPDGLANGQEWRTPPLWGIGLTRLVSGQTHFLHDGRAKSLEEAILWHGGEADRSKNKFINLTAAERQALIAFLNSL